MRRTTFRPRWYPSSAHRPHLRDRADVDVELIVVDNNSTDGTVEVAEAMGATVVGEPVQGIGRARNCGASVAQGDVLIFVDADVILPPTLFEAIYTAMSDPACVGGGVEVEYRPQRLVIRLYLRGWRYLARLTGMVQGATQFCRRSAFQSVGGYDENVWMGEDVNLFWSLKKLAKATGQRVQVVRTPKVLPSTRRFDKLPVWKVLLFTNPALHHAVSPMEVCVGGLVPATSALGHDDRNMDASAHQFSSGFAVGRTGTSYPANWPDHLAIVAFRTCLGRKDRLCPRARAGGRGYRCADIVFVSVGPVLGGEARALGQQHAVLAGEAGRVYEVALLFDLKLDSLGGVLQPREDHAGRGVEPARRQSVHDRLLCQLVGLNHHPAAAGIRHPRGEVVIVVRVVGGHSEDRPGRS